VYVHRIVASQKLGRWICSWEHVHHVDGVRSNNDPNNLVVLSASEHAIEEKRLKGFIRRYVECSVCGKRTSNQEFCSARCQGMNSRKFIVTKDELENMICVLPMTRIGKIYGVSDNAIRKRCKILGVDLSLCKFSKPRKKNKSQV